MNKEAIKEWISDLKSGKYKQSFGALKKPDGGYCCLGVACETYKKLTGKGTWVGNDEDDFSFVIYGIDDSYTEDSEYLQLPRVVASYFGFNTPEVDLQIVKESCITYSNAIALNDSQYYNFEDIAKMIEDSYLSNDEQKKNENKETVACSS